LRVDRLLVGNIIKKIRRVLLTDNVTSQYEERHHPKKFTCLELNVLQNVYFKFFLF